MERDVQNLSDEGRHAEGSVHRGAIGALFLLCLIGFLNSIDARVMGAIAESIKIDMGLTDTQVGVLTGFAFSVCYALVSLPIARLSDRHNRARIIAAALAFWSAMTALCALSNTYAKLVMARMGVAVGESAYNPAAYSLVADYFPPRFHARAMSALSVATALGTLVSFVAGGWIAQAFGWRTVFLALGLPGVVLGLITWFLLPEPRKDRSSAEAAEPQGNAWQNLGEIIRTPGYMLMVAGGAALSFSMGALLVWSASLLQRVHGWGIGDTGTMLGLLFGISSIASPLIITHLGDALSKKRRSAHLTVLVMLSIGAIISLTLGLMVRNPLANLTGICLAFAVASGWIPSILATIRSLIDGRKMASATAIVGLCANLLGLGLGPFAIGAASDAMAASFGGDAIRFALLLCVAAFSIAVICFSTAARSLRV